MDFNEITYEVFNKLKTDKFDESNEKHIECLKDVLSNHIKNEELLFHVMMAFKYPDGPGNSKFDK